MIGLPSGPQPGPRPFWLKPPWGPELFAGPPWEPPGPEAVTNSISGAAEDSDGGSDGSGAVMQGGETGAQTPSWWVCQGCIFAFLLGIEHVLLAASFLESGFYVEFIWSGA